MSQANVEIMRGLYGAWTRGDHDAFLSMVDPEIEWRGPREWPDLAEPRYGPEGIRDYLRTISEVLDDYRMAPEEFIDAGSDRVLVLSREGGRGKTSGAEVQTHLTAHVWTLRDGKPVQMQSYWERADAFQAVGLAE